MQDKYDSYLEGSSQSYDNTEIKTTPHASLEFEVERVFGTAHPDFGQSLGIAVTNATVTDGALYRDADKGTYKLFSLKEAGATKPADAVERGMEVTTDDVDVVLNKSPLGHDKTYDLVGVVVPEYTDEDGEVVIEGSSMVRSVEETEDGDLEFGEWEDLGGEPFDIEGELIMWQSGNDEYGPSSASKRLAQVLTEFGTDAIVDEGDLHNWLADTSGEDIGRDDLEDRPVEFFKVIRTSEDGYNYHRPVVRDLKTGEEIGPKNAGDSRSGGSDTTEQAAAAADAAGNEYPEPVTDFVGSAGSLDLTPDRAETLLLDMADDDENALTREMIDEIGKGVIIQEVT